MDPRQIQALLAQMNGGGGLGGSGASNGNVLCEFKAGKMNFDGKMVTPDRRKGWVRVEKDPLQPGMVNFNWCDESKKIVDSYILFPDSAKFVKVKQSDDRVYLLEIAPEPRRLFFWMQDEEKDGDADRCKKCHNAINGVTENSESSAAGGTPAAAASTSQPAASSSAAASSRPRMAESGFQTSAAGAAQHQLGANPNAMMDFFNQMQAQAQAAQTSPSIGDVITAESLQKLLSDMTEEEKQEMKQHLPDGQKETDEQLRVNLLSPQLRQAMKSLTEACLTSQENVVMIMAMCELDMDGQDENLGLEAVIRGFIKKYEDGDGQ